MRAFRDMSIQRKLTLIIVATSAAAMVVGALVSFGYEMSRARQTLVNDMTAQAEIVGAHCAAALAFQDEKTALEILQTLEARPEILSVCLYTVEGVLFVEYLNPQTSAAFAPLPVLFEPFHRFESGLLVLSRPLKLGNDLVGAIGLRADQRELRALLAKYAAIVLVVVAGLLGFSLWLAGPLQRLVSAPIVKLTSLTQRVTVSQDYSLRARQESADEVGTLAGGINAMLERIEERDRRLRQAHDNLRLSEERFRQLAESITQVFWLTNVRKTEMIYVSPGYEKIWGRTCASLYHAPQDWLNAVHPEDRARVREAALAKQISGEYDEEYRILRPDGTVRWVRDRAFPIADANGNVFRIGGIAADITERKQVEDALRASERKHRDFIEEATDGILLADAAGKVVLFNPAARAMLGYSEEEVGQLTVWDTYAPEELQLAAERLADLQARRSLRHERRLRRKDGTYLMVEVHAKLQTDGRIQVILRDISERKRLEQELLDITERERSRIGQDLHDSLCQHLISTTFAARSLEKKLAAQARPEADSAGKIAGFLDEAVNQARSLARGLYPVGVETEGLAFALTELAATVNRVSTVQCRVDCPQPVSIANPAVSTHLYRITQEAIANALKHGQATEITIALAQEDNRVVLSVEDNGRGLAVAPTPRDGMGLRIMQYRARMIGGNLEVKRRPRGGTQVRCAFRPRGEPSGDHHDNGQK